MALTEIEILFEETEFVLVNKVAGESVQPDKTSGSSVLERLEEKYGHPVFVINRIDRPVSGVVLFAKNEKSAAKLNTLFREHKVDKTYWAAVSVKPDPTSGELVHYLRKDGAKNKSYAFNKPLHHTKEAKLSYELLKSGDRYHLVEIKLHTGRHHQIRSQMQVMGWFIKGDVKYGARRKNKDQSIHLHAKSLRFISPFSGEEVAVQASCPSDSLWNALTEKD